jgi:cell division protein FtsZ
MSLQEVNEVAEVISGICAPDANIIFGTSVDESYGDEIAVTVVATSFEVPGGDDGGAAAPPGIARPEPPKYSEWQASPPPRRGFWNRF